MLEETRLHRIRTLLTTLNQISTEQLAQDLGVSRETVRRDVIKLESMGVLRRVHGGVVSTDPAPEPPLAVRNTVRAREKQLIARAAVQQLSAGQTLFIDAGSTTSILAEALISMPSMTIITNSLTVATTLAGTTAPGLKPDHEVILLGGQMDSSAQATIGAGTVSEISRYRADIALLSPVGIHSEVGASCFAQDEAAVASAMARHARDTLILADHSKVGISSRIIYAGISEVDMLITDTAAVRQQDLEALQQAVHVVLA